MNRREVLNSLVAAQVALGRVPYAGAKAYFYLTGTTTVTNTYSDSALSVANSNPVVADSAGVFVPIYLDPNVTYRLALEQSDGTLIYTIDPVNDPLNASIIGTILYPQSSQERAVGVTPANFQYVWGDVRRYGFSVDGSTDDYAAAAASGVSDLDLIFPSSTICVLSDNVTFSGDVVFEPGAKVKPASGKWVKFMGRVQETGASILDDSHGGNVVLTNDPQYSYANATYSVVSSPSAPNEFATLQQAIDATPRYIGHVITIEVSKGTYSGITAKNKSLTNDSPAEWYIKGDTAMPANVIVQGAAFHALKGYLFPKISGIKFSGGLGQGGGDECVVFAINCDAVELKYFSIDGSGVGASGTNADAGILAYNATLNVTLPYGIDNCDSPIWTKHGGRINVSDQAIPSSGATYPYQSSVGDYKVIKQIAYANPSTSLSNQINGGKRRSGEFVHDQYMAHIAGPGYFLSSASTIETVFESIDGYTNRSSGGGFATVGSDGLSLDTGGGTVDIYLQRARLSAAGAYRRPIFVTFCADVANLPSGEVLYIGVGQPHGSGDFLGFKLTSRAIEGAVWLVGAESTVNVRSAAAFGETRIGLLYSPATTDKTVESAATNYVTYFDFDSNTAVRLTMSSDFSDTTMQRRFAAYSAQASNAVRAKIGHYKYIQA